jgi:PPM family protein phosphatase
MLVELSVQTEAGHVRKQNEDNYLILDLTSERSCTRADGEIPQEMRQLEIGPRGLVLAVSDGMGGALAGDIASRLAVEAVREMLIDEFDADHEDERCLINSLMNAVVYANLSIHLKSLEDSRLAGMGATFTAAAINGVELDLGQVGDSRAYVVRGMEIRQVTKDQSLVQQLVDVGQITEAEAETHMFRNVILQALGAQSELAIVTGRIRLCRNDILLLCSDGITGKINSERLRDIIHQSRDLTAAGKALVNEVLEGGGEDNITIILARFLGEDLSPADECITIELPPLQDDKTLDDTYEVSTEPY